MAVKDAAPDEDAALSAHETELAEREAEQEQHRLGTEHHVVGHLSYTSGCPECVAEFDTPDDAHGYTREQQRLANAHLDHTAYIEDCPECVVKAAMIPASDEQDAPYRTTPYERLVDLLSAPTRCSHCGRTDPYSPAMVAAKVGLSETAVRRLTQPDAAPTMRAVAIMAKSLDLPVTRLLGVLWPALAQA